MAIQRDNVSIDVKAGKIVLTIDPKQDCGESASKKNITVASTRGNVELSGFTGLGGFKLGLNCYKPIPQD